MLYNELKTTQSYFVHENLTELGKGLPIPHPRL